jgi:hypothetical protein
MIVAVIISVLSVVILSALFLWFRSSPKQQVPDAPTTVVVAPAPGQPPQPAPGQPPQPATGLAKKLERAEQPQVAAENRNPWNRWQA